jgi:DNA-binding FrmR family transcriptional regulator
MSHLIANRDKLKARLGRLQGQLAAVERLLDADRPCGEVLNLVASIRGAVNGLTAELMEDHIRSHVSDPETEDDTARAKGATELIAAVRSYLK